MSFKSPFSLLFVALLVLPCQPIDSLNAAQAPAPQRAYEFGTAQTRGRTMAEAIAAYQETSSAPDAERLAAVSELSRFEAPEIAALLIEEEARASLPELRRVIAQGLGRQRGSALRVDALARLLDSSADDFALRNTSVDALARAKEAGVEVLADRWRRLQGVPSDPQTRSLKQALLRGLARSEVDVGVDLVAAAVGEGDQSDRLVALNELRRAPSTPSVEKARELALADRDLALAVEALRQLAESNHPSAKTSALRIAERVQSASTTIPIMTRAALVEALAFSLTDKSYPALLTAAPFDARPVQTALQSLLPRLTTDDGFVAFLRTKGLTQSSAAEQVTAVRILADASQPGVTDSLLTMVQSKEATVALATIRALATRADSAAVPALRRLLRGNDVERRFEAMEALHRILKTDAGWHKELLDFARSRNVRERLLAFDLLSEAEVLDVLPLAWRATQERSWPLRAAAYGAMQKVRSIDSIPVLLSRLDKETGRLHEDVLDALEALTRLRFLQTSQWEPWWAEAKAGYVLPPPPPPAEASARPRSTTGTVSYYDLPMTSTKAVFVVDVSGSMSAKLGTGGTTRIAEAKRQLKQVLEPLPDHYMVNIIPFANGASAFANGMRRADRATKTAFLAQIEALAASGGTNLYAALLLAFEDQDLDTIYLLSDGSPSSGEITDPAQLADEVARWNRTRRIQIHCVAVGTDSDLLKRLAADSGGRYTRVF